MNLNCSSQKQARVECFWSFEFWIYFECLCLKAENYCFLQTSILLPSPRPRIRRIFLNIQSFIYLIVFLLICDKWTHLLSSLLLRLLMLRLRMLLRLLLLLLLLLPPLLLLQLLPPPPFPRSRIGLSSLTRMASAWRAIAQRPILRYFFVLFSCVWCFPAFSRTSAQVRSGPLVRGKEIKDKEGHIFKVVWSFNEILSARWNISLISLIAAWGSFERWWDEKSRLVTWSYWET